MRVLQKILGPACAKLEHYGAAFIGPRSMEYMEGRNRRTESIAISREPRRYHLLIIVEGKK